MSTNKTLKRTVSSLGIGVLFIWWGIVIIIDPITIAMGAIGTGLILLGLNGFRRLKGFSTVESSTVLGLTALLWGLLDQGRIMLVMPASMSFALLLIVIGVMIGIYPLVGNAKPA